MIHLQMKNARVRALAFSLPAHHLRSGLSFAQLDFTNTISLSTIMLIRFIHNKSYFNKDVLLRKLLKNKRPSFYYYGLKDRPSVPKCCFYVKDFHQQIKKLKAWDKVKPKTIWHLPRLQRPKHWTSKSPQLLTLCFMTSGNIFMLLILFSTYRAP